MQTTNQSTPDLPYQIEAFGRPAGHLVKGDTFRAGVPYQVWLRHIDKSLWLTLGADNISYKVRMGVESCHYTDDQGQPYVWLQCLVLDWREDTNKSSK